MLKVLRRSVPTMALLALSGACSSDASGRRVRTPEEPTVTAADAVRRDDVERSKPEDEARLPAFPETAALTEQLHGSELAPGVTVVQWKHWAANTLLVEAPEGDLVLVDAPPTTRSTRDFLDWVLARYKKLPTIAFSSHFHFDGSGGNAELRRRGIPIHGADLTVAMLQVDGAKTREEALSHLDGFPDIQKELEETELALPDHVYSATEGFEIRIGGEDIRVIHLGGGHTPDHVAIYFPRRNLVYGGCAVRHGSRLEPYYPGHLRGWKAGMQGLLELEPEIVVPGHGDDYTSKAIDNTLRLLDAALLDPQAR